MPDIKKLTMSKAVKQLTKDMEQMRKMYDRQIMILDEVGYCGICFRKNQSEYLTNHEAGCGFVAARNFLHNLGDYNEN